MCVLWSTDLGGGVEMWTELVVCIRRARDYLSICYAFTESGNACAMSRSQEASARSTDVHDLDTRLVDSYRAFAKSKAPGLIGRNEDFLWTSAYFFFDSLQD